MTAALHNPHGTAFGLMDEVYGPGTAQALRDSGGPWEMYAHTGWDGLVDAPAWADQIAYRLKPQPPKPREFWLCAEPGSLWVVLDQKPETEWDEVIHVREVLP